MCIGGSYVALDAISTGDIVGDGSNVAVVPLDSGGSIGESGSLIFLLDPSRGPQLMTTEGPGGAVFIDGGQLVALGPDPNTNCSTLACFDGMLRMTYKLVGGALQQTGACTYLPDPTDLRKAQGACTPYNG
jgi:hypothetical protein